MCDGLGAGDSLGLGMTIVRLLCGDSLGFGMTIVWLLCGDNSGFGMTIVRLLDRALAKNRDPRLKCMSGRGIIALQVAPLRLCTFCEVKK